MKTKMNVKRLLAVSLAAMMTATAFAGCVIQEVHHLSPKRIQLQQVHQ